MRGFERLEFRKGASFSLAYFSSSEASTKALKALNEVYNEKIGKHLLLDYARSGEIQGEGEEGKGQPSVLSSPAEISKVRPSVILQQLTHRKSQGYRFTPTSSQLKKSNSCSKSFLLSLGKGLTLHP